MQTTGKNETHLQVEPEVGEAPPILETEIARRFYAVVAIIVGSIVLGIALYPERFRFWPYPLSDLGATLSEHGNSNLASILAFDSGMIASSVVMFSAAGRLRRTEVRHVRIKYWLSTLCAAGFIVVTCPWNVNDAVHMAGGSAVIASFWAFTLTLLLELRPSIGSFRFWTFQFFLQASVLPYGTVVVLNSPSKQAIQKFAVALLMFVMVVAARMALRTNRTDTAFPGEGALPQ